MDGNLRRQSLEFYMKLKIPIQLSTSFLLVILSLISFLQSTGMALGKTATQEVEMASPVDLEAITTHASEIHHLNEKVFDGDDALKVLHTHYEPYSPAEEKALLRKIDWRMCSLMLIISKYF